MTSSVIQRILEQASRMNACGAMAGEPIAITKSEKLAVAEYFCQISRGPNGVGVDRSDVLAALECGRVFILERKVLIL